MDMKHITKIFIAAIAFTNLLMVSCQKEDTVAKAVLVSESVLTVPAQDAQDQFVTVYADADWVCDVPSWITVSPSSGTGTMDVTLSFADNMRDGAVDNPRKDTVIFRGNTLASYAYLVIQQDGDKYRDLQQKTLTEISQEPREAFVYAKESQVVALSTNGFVVSDNANVLFVESANLPAIGDVVTFYGYISDLNGIKSVANCEMLNVVSNASVSYPAENDVTATFDAYSSSVMDYILLDGVYEKGKLKVNDAKTMNCLMYNPVEEMGLSAMDGHKVTIKGYHAGTVGSTVYVIPVQVIDNGVDEIIYFSDTFDWLAPIVADSGAGDSMGKAGDDAAKNGYTSAGCESFAAELANQGYEDLFPSSKTIYIQKNYLKFSKGSNANGIKLPAVNYGGTTNIVLTFDWGTHVGSGGADKVNLVVEVEGNGEVVSSGFDHTAGDWTWQKETVLINGVDDNTRIIIKPSTFTGTVTSGYYRWYLDNIKIAQGEGPAPGGPVEVFNDNFDWVQPFVEADDPTKQGDSMLDNKQYTPGTSYSIAGFEDALAQSGYEALFPDSKAIYVMKGNYLKFSKGKNINGIRLPKMDFRGKSKATLSFDWGINEGANGADAVELEVTVEGNGTINGEQKTSALIHTAGSWEWQTETIEIEGVDNDTRITIRPTTFAGEVESTGYYRWFLDNVNVSAK